MLPDEPYLIKLSDYAKLYNININTLRNLRTAGRFTGARMIAGIWLVDRRRPPNQEDYPAPVITEEEKDLVTALQYATLYHTTSQEVTRKLNTGAFKSGRKIGGVWMLDKNEIPNDRRICTGKYSKKIPKNP